MNNSTEPALKMRFRLPNGEEFEAEGSREFIETQRNYFLNLIGHAQRASTLLPTEQQNTQPAARQHTAVYLWEQIFKEDGNTLILRKKGKLSIVDAALLILAGAQVLLKQVPYSALDLSKSLKASGITGGRLDRILSPEIEAGHLQPQGSKRGRSYQLSDSGFAKAFTLAEKLSQN